MQMHVLEQCLLHLHNGIASCAGASTHSWTRKVQCHFKSSTKQQAIYTSISNCCAQYALHYLRNCKGYDLITVSKLGLRVIIKHCQFILLCSPSAAYINEIHMAIDTLGMLS